MISPTGLKLFMALWYTGACMRRMTCGEQSIEYALEFAVANETDVTNLNGRGLSRVRLPQGVAESRMRDCELIAKSVVVGHCGTDSESGTKPMNVDSAGQSSKEIAASLYTAPSDNDNQSRVQGPLKDSCAFQT